MPDAGFVHLSCLTKYAAAKSKRWDGRVMKDFREPWLTCPSCHQCYQNDLAVDIASKFVSFVRGQYPRDTQKQVESLDVKLCAFDSMFERLQPEQKREFGVTANVLLSLIDRLKREVSSPLPNCYSHFEGDAYNALGIIALNEGSEESARRAESYFKKDLKVSKVIGDADGIANAKSNIAIAKSMYEGGNNNEELLKASQELYEMRVATHGEGNEFTIIAGKIYAFDLQKANRREEARELLMKLVATSKQVFGLIIKSPRTLNQCSNAQRATHSSECNF
jgi:hypothetical protein